MTGKDMLKITLNLTVIYLVGGLLLAGAYSLTSPIIFQKNKEEKEAALARMMPVHLKMKLPESTLEKAKGLMPEGASPPTISKAEGGLVTLDVELDLYEKELNRLLKNLRKKAGATEIEEYSLNETVKEGDWEPWHKHAEYFRVMSEGAPVGYIVETYGKGYSSYINVLTAVDKDFSVRKINVLHHAETPGLGDEIELAWFKDMYKDKGVDDLVVVKGEAGEKIQAITGATISTRAVTDGVRDGVKMLVEKYAGDEEVQEVTE
jgi:electron transport complex protein RnfG